MLDRLNYRNTWFALPNQRPLEECFWQQHRQKKPRNSVGGASLRSDDYACDWKIDQRKLWLLSVQLDDDGSDLIPRIAPGAVVPIMASWHSGSIDANGESYIRRSAEVHDESTVIPIIRFHVEKGIVVLTEHLNHTPQLGWQENEPTHRIRTDWKQSPNGEA